MEKPTLFRKSIKKALRVSLVGLFLVLLLMALIAGLVQVSYVQHKLVDFTTSRLSSFLQTQVRLEGLRYLPPRGLELNGLYIEDQKGDTLAFAEALRVNVGRVDLEHDEYAVALTELIGGRVFLNRETDSTDLNLQFIVDAFASEEADTTKTKFELNFEEVQLERCAFKYDVFSIPHTEFGIDYNHLFVRGVNGAISDIDIKGTTISGTLERFTLIEQSGFQLSELQSKVLIMDTLISCERLVVRSSGTVTKADLRLEYEQWSSFADFIHEVQIVAVFDSAQIAMSDLAFFVPQFKGIDRYVALEGSMEGSISDFTVDNLYLQTAGSTSLRADARIIGLPDIEKTFIDAKIERVYTTVEDLESAPLPPFGQGKTILLPIEAKRLKFLEFSGSFLGSITDFVAYGSASTAHGSMEMDINLKRPDSLSAIQYSGKIASQGLNLGAVLDRRDQLGKLAFDLKVEGSDFDWKVMRSKVEGKVTLIEVLRYPYRNIDVNGTFEEGIFDGQVDIKDENIDFDFVGAVDFNPNFPSMKFAADIKKLRLAPLNLFESDTFGLVTGNVQLDVAGSSFQDAHGLFVGHDITYANDQRTLYFDTLSLADFDTTGIREVHIESDYFNAQFRGTESTPKLSGFSVELLKHYMPKLFATEAEQPTNEEPNDRWVEFELEIKKSRKLWNIIAPELYFDDNIELEGKMSLQDYSIHLSSSPISVDFKNYRIQNLVTSINSTGDTLYSTVKASSIDLSGEPTLLAFKVKSQLYNNISDHIIDWRNETVKELANKGQIKLRYSILDQDTFKLRVYPSKFYIGETPWEVEQMAFVRFEGQSTEVEGLRIASEKGLIEMDGRVGDGENDNLDLNMSNFNLSYLSDLSLVTMPMSGWVNGKVALARKDSSYRLDANLRMDTVVLKDIELGDISLTSNYNSSAAVGTISANLKYRGAENLSITGQYFPKEKEENLKLKAYVANFRLVSIQSFIDAYVTNLEGTINGEVAVTGKFENPVVEGNLDVRGTKFKVVYLNTAYNSPLIPLRFNEEFIGFDQVKLVDQKGSVATMTGTILHEAYENLNYDIAIQAKNFLCLNTTLADNELFYGTTNITGDVSVSGYTGQTLIEMIAKTEPDTKLSIPLDFSGDVSNLDYIRFVNKERELPADIAAEQDASSLMLDFQLDVTPDAEIQIIFDEKVGDIIKVRGAGDMLMEIDTKGKFNMYGQYVIEEGDYLFTLQNVVNKRFNISQNSSITWSGSPYDARVDIGAIYKLRASPYDLVSSFDTSSYYQQRMPVEVYLNMKGRLMEPNITFDIDLPSLPESDLANQMLTPAGKSSQSMNQQVFSLLLTNRFYAQQGISATGITSSTTNELISNQFSNWISQYFNNWDVGLNLRNGVEGSGGDQAELNVSTQLFDDRVLVEVNGSVQSNNANAEDASNVAGEFNIEYKVNQDGSLRARVFNEANNYNSINYQSPYTQGAGISYRTDFNTFSDLWRKIKSGFTRKDESSEEQTSED